MFFIKRTAEFHLGFPVDTGNLTTQYYLLYPENRKYQRIGVIGQKKLVRMDEKTIPQGITIITDILKRKKRSLLFMNSKICVDNTIITDNDYAECLPSGGSASVACYLAGHMHSGHSIPEDTDSPVILISCGFYGVPEKELLARVTGRDDRESEKSLMKKWQAAESISMTERCSILMLEKEDYILIKNLLNRENRSFKTIRLDELNEPHPKTSI